MANRERFSPWITWTGNFNSYIENISRDRVWGGDQEINAYCLDVEWGQKINAVEKLILDSSDFGIQNISNRNKTWLFTNQR